MDNRTHMMATILRNKEYRSVVRDAMKAPPGSTKVQKAQKMASVMHRTLARFGQPVTDGQGGPGTNMYSSSGPGTYYANTQPLNRDPDFQNMVIFKAPPGPSQNNAAPAPIATATPATTNDGQGGPGFNFGGSINNAASPMSSYSNLSGMGSGFSLSPNATPTPSTNSRLLSISGAMPAPPPGTAGAMPKDPTQLNITDPTNPSNFNYVNPFSVGASAGFHVTPNPNAAPPSPAQMAAPAPVAPPAMPTAPTGLPDGTSPLTPAPAPGGTGAATISTMSGSDILGGGDTTGTAPDGSALPSGYQGIADAAQGAVNGSLGPATFAAQQMNDINTLRTLMPGVPDDQLPVGASLSQQIGDLETTLKQENNLDALQSSLTQKINDGTTIQQDLQDYVRGKDEYLNKVNDMLQPATQAAIDAMGTPHEAEANAYVDYLTTIKGRQNQRYMDFYNGAISQYQAQLGAMQDNLTTATNKYTSELNDKSTLVQDDYNRIYNQLTDLYNTVDQAPQKQLELAQLAQQLGGTAAGAAGDAADSISSKWISEFGNLKNQGVLVDNKTGTLLPNITSLEPALETILSNGQTDIGGANRILGEAMANSITIDPATGSSYTNAGDLLSNVQKYEDMLTEYKQQSQSPDFQAKYGVDIGPTIDNMAANLGSLAGQQLSGMIGNDASALKQAVTGLVNGEGGFLQKKTVPNEQVWVNEHKSSALPASLLSRVYDVYNAIQQADPRGTSMQTLLTLPDDQFAQSLSNSIGQVLFTAPATINGLTQ